MKRPEVSIISINYNQLEVTLDMLRSLGETVTRYEIIIVDNNSRTDPRATIQSEFSTVKCIRSPQNLGFAGGNNLGLKHAHGDFVFFVNNDTLIPEGTIEALKASLCRTPDIGVACPRIYFDSDRDTLQYAGYSPINPLTGRNQAIGYGSSLPQSQACTTTSYAHGAAMMVKRTVIEEVGIMPEHFFLYYEELDWASQIRRRGYRIVVNHGAKIYHRESMSVGKSSPLKTYFQTRNRILFMRRNNGWFSFVLFMAFFLFASLPKHIIVYTLHRQYAHLLNFLAAIKWNLMHAVQSPILGYGYDELKR